MKLSFWGADREVTGSCHMLEAAGKKILVDCGMQQGPDEYDNQEIPFAPGEIDYVLVTHAHIDHTGRIPLLYKLGFSGEIHATGATADLCSIMLRDSAHIQEFEAEWKNRKGKRAGRDVVEPLYTMADAEGALSLFHAWEYGKTVDLCPGIRIRFVDVGHLLGSASVEVWVTENGATQKIVFSGDIGNLHQPLINDPQYITEADYVVMESTYGDRNHEATGIDYAATFAQVIQETFDRGGNVVIPSFAVGRTQELLYFLRHIKTNDMVKGHGNFPVYVDSPLAIEATNIFRENIYGYFDPEAMELVSQGINPISFPGLKVAVTSDESKAINFDEQKKIIISASGMCEAGRIKHHLKHNLWRKECTVVFVGFQAVGTLGRSLIEGAKSVKLFGEEIDVRARIVRMPGISGHADQAGLLRWLDSFSPRPRKVFVVHGEDEVCTSFAALAASRCQVETTAPYFGACYDLATGACLEPGVRRQPQQKARVKQPSGIFGRLVAAVQRLVRISNRYEECANSDIAKFADQVEALCDKWEIQD